MFQECRKEIRAIFQFWPIWYLLGTQDIRLRYRRSTLGPFWITVSMAVTILSMGFLYGHLFQIKLTQYFPFLAAGLIGWSFIASLLSESSQVFIESEAYLKNQESYLSLFVMRLILRNVLVLLHNLLVFIPILFLFSIPIGLYTFVWFPGILLIAVNALFWGNLLAIIGTRFRDFFPIITSLIQVIFFLTPVMWMPSLLPAKYQWIVTYNPFYQFLTLFRAPLLHTAISVETWGVVAIFSLLGFFLYTYFLSKYKYKVVFWL